MSDVEPGRTEAGRGRSARRAQIGVGVGLAAMLGAATYLMTYGPAGEVATTATTTSLPGPASGQPSDVAGTSAAGAPARTPDEATAALPPGVATAWLPPDAARRMAAARKAAAEHGVDVLRPLVIAPNPAGEAAASTAKVTDTGSLRKNGATMRVVTAPGDLTGQRELAWVAGGIAAHGAAHCSQTFRFSRDRQPARNPNVLVCWRTSARKSVVTVAVDVDGDPSEKRSVSTIEREWLRSG